MNKTILSILLFVLPSLVVANDRPSNACIASYHASYSKSFAEYWNMIDKEFKNRNPKLYEEFSYLIAEQLNNSKMNEIKLSYFLKNHPDEIDINKNIFRMMPSAANYTSKHFRELRKNPKFNRLYLENYSYRHNVKMPNFEKLQAVSQLLAEIKLQDNIQTYQRDVEKNASKPVMELDCNS